MRALLIAIFSRLGGYLFEFMAVSTDKNGEAFAFHFSDNQRAMNIAMRDYVEALDESYTDSET